MNLLINAVSFCNTLRHKISATDPVWHFFIMARLGQANASLPGDPAQIDRLWGAARVHPTANRQQII